MYIDYNIHSPVRDREFDNYLMEITGIITDFDEHDNLCKIGKIRAYYVDAMQADDAGESLVEIFEIHGGLPEILEGLLTQSEKLSSRIWKPFDWEPIYTPSNFLIIDAVAIQAKYRGGKKGLAAIYRTIQQFAHGCKFVVLSVTPLQFHSGFKFLPKNMALRELTQDKEMAKEMLKKYYAQLGFKPIPKSDLMIMNLDYNRPNLDDIGYQS